MVPIRILFSCSLALAVTSQLGAAIIYGTSTTTPLTYGGSLDGNLTSGGFQYGIEFAVPTGQDYVATGFAAPLGNAFHGSTVSVTFTLYTAVPRVPATTPPLQQPGVALDSAAFNIPNTTSINVYTPLFAGGAILQGGKNYFLIGKVNTTGGFTQIDWAQATSGTETTALKSGSQPWVIVTGFTIPAVQIFGDLQGAAIPEPTTLALAAAGILFIAISRRKRR